MKIEYAKYLQELEKGNPPSLARIISLVENEAPGYEELLRGLLQRAVPVVGITGPPGAGKSTLTNALIAKIVSSGKKVAVVCVDPSSPFNRGALLGDRIRMNEWYNNPNVFIRSLATRGSLGGLHPRIIEIIEVLKAAAFDLIFVETVGVGQSEVEIAGLADATVVVLVPESGDDIQAMKAGLMEIADLFVVNKCDRPGADNFVKDLRARTGDKPIPVLKTVANTGQGIEALYDSILSFLEQAQTSEKKYRLLAQRMYHIIRDKRMKDVDIEKLVAEIKSTYERQDFNLYKLITHYV